ncbi:MAG: hypothetical protein M3083_00395 [Actinomycetota bacterium]|nr:hypothetical protein [Actinomycetota bacterium]
MALEIVEYCLEGYFSRPEDSLHSEVDPIATSCQSDTLDQGKKLLGVNGLFGSQEVGEGMAACNRLPLKSGQVGHSSEARSVSCGSALRTLERPGSNQVATRLAKEGPNMRGREVQPEYDAARATFSMS